MRFTWVHFEHRWTMLAKAVVGCSLVAVTMVESLGRYQDSVSERLFGHFANDPDVVLRLIVAIAGGVLGVLWELRYMRKESRKDGSENSN